MPLDVTGHQEEEQVCREFRRGHMSFVTTRKSPSCLQTLTPQQMSSHTQIRARKSMLPFLFHKVVPCPNAQGQPCPGPALTMCPLTMPRAGPPLFPGTGFALLWTTSPSFLSPPLLQTYSLGALRKDSRAFLQTRGEAQGNMPQDFPPH